MDCDFCISCCFQINLPLVGLCVTCTYGPLNESMTCTYGTFFPETIHVNLKCVQYGFESMLHIICSCTVVYDISLVHVFNILHDIIYMYIVHKSLKHIFLHWIFRPGIVFTIDIQRIYTYL